MSRNIIVVLMYHCHKILDLIVMSVGILCGLRCQKSFGGGNFPLNSNSYVISTPIMI